MFVGSKDPLLLLGLRPYFLELSEVPSFKGFYFIAWPYSLVF